MLLLDININILYFFRLLMLDIFGFIFVSVFNKENVNKDLKSLVIYLLYNVL